MGAGSIKGDVLLEVSQPAGLTSSRFSIAQSVRVTGQLEGQGKVLDNTQKRLALLLGLATESRDGLKANVQFADGILKANGKTYDLRGNLTYFDGLITGYLYPR